MLISVAETEVILNELERKKAFDNILKMSKHPKSFNTDAFELLVKNLKLGH